MFKFGKKKSDTVKAYQQTFGTVHGRTVLFDMLKTHSMISSTFNTDVNRMLIKEGERNVVLRILALLKTDPDKFLQQVESGLDEEKSYE
jgi:hypothetical protein